jgi:hypothetical protein
LHPGLLAASEELILSPFEHLASCSFGMILRMEIDRESIHRSALVWLGIAAVIAIMGAAFLGLGSSHVPEGTSDWNSGWFVFGTVLLAVAAVCVLFVIYLQVFAQYGRKAKVPPLVVRVLQIVAIAVLDAVSKGLGRPIYNVFARRGDGIWIESAYYGPADEFGRRVAANVTQTVRGVIGEGGTQFLADNPTLCGSEENDPYKFVLKSLRLQWRVHGKRVRHVFTENATVNLRDTDPKPAPEPAA